MHIDIAVVVVRRETRQTGKNETCTRIIMANETVLKYRSSAAKVETRTTTTEDELKQELSLSLSLFLCSKQVGIPKLWVWCSKEKENGTLITYATATCHLVGPAHHAQDRLLVVHCLCQITLGLKLKQSWNMLRVATSLSCCSCWYGQSVSVGHWPPLCQ